MKIGELAAQAAVNIQTVRFYERRGILPEPTRSPSGYRCYGESDLETLCFIRRSQSLGFTLREISQLLPLHRSVATLAAYGPNHAQNRRVREMRQMATVARSRLDQVEQKLQLLKTMRRQLQTFILQLETTAPEKCLAPLIRTSKSKKICPGS